MITARVTESTENECGMRVLKASCILGCDSKFIASRLKELVISLYPALVVLQLKYCVEVHLSMQERSTKCQ